MAIGVFLLISFKYLGNSLKLLIFGLDELPILGKGELSLNYFYISLFT